MHCACQDDGQGEDQRGGNPAGQAQQRHKRHEGGEDHAKDHANQRIGPDCSGTSGCGFLSVHGDGEPRQKAQCGGQVDGGDQARVVFAQGHVLSGVFSG